MHEVLVNRLGGLSLPRKSVVKLTDRPNMTLDVYRGRKTTKQQQITDGVYPYILILFQGKEAEADAVRKRIADGCGSDHIMLVNAFKVSWSPSSSVD